MITTRPATLHDAERIFAEAILFIKANNPRSLRTHVRLGMVQVASFTLDGEVFAVLSGRS